AVLLALPRSVEPEAPPLPQVDRLALAATMHQDEAWAREAADHPLDVAVRAVGREMRAYNELVAKGEREPLGEARASLIRAVKTAIAVDEVGLAKLRAYQTLRFVEELRGWRAGSPVSQELIALGGDFPVTLGLHRWCAPSGELLLDEITLRAFFKRRWTTLAAVTGPLFDASLDEERVRYRFLLQHPPTGSRFAALPPPGSPMDRIQRGQARLDIIRSLGEKDPSYPQLIAKGAVLYRMGRFAEAAEAYQRHLGAAPDGPYAILAQNHLKAALDHTVDTGP
ncbi:MAG: hypothetical protein KC731_11380, partial [Myxococcales bacterium]|nr:hypothetical protein [Myxococcales bacterium]